MSGIAVSEEWNTKARTMSSKLGSTFNDDVDFAWEVKVPTSLRPNQSKVQGVVEEIEHDPEHHLYRRGLVEVEANKTAAVEEENRGRPEDLSQKVFDRLVGQRSKRKHDIE
jgi:hypothetical protein